MIYYCAKCNKWWHYPVKKCIFCDGDVVEASVMDYKVIGYTEVFVPSVNNEKVPYFVYLLENEAGNRRIIKSYDEHSMGDTVDLE
jgi:uncharacterized OB-fold protein